MTDQTLLAKARKARFDDLPNFSGHPSEDVERFLKSMKNITKTNDESNKKEAIEIVRGKLVQSAGIWFDNNESKFKEWADFESAFRSRYFSSTITHKKFDTLKQRKQSHNESIISYCDDVINLCREIDSTMSEQIIIQHLMSGINPDCKKELSRRESSMKTLDEFLKYAKIEQDLHDTFGEYNNLLNGSQQPYTNGNRSLIPSSTAMINKPKQQYYRNIKQNDRQSYPTSTQSSGSRWNSIPQTRNRLMGLPDQRTSENSQPFTFKKKQINYQSISGNKFSNCKICNRTNHRTIHCFHKHKTGCFKCGHLDHNIRDCTTTQNFQ
jgi:hypothetical protein